MPVPLISPAAKEFSTYLVGADEFYRGEFESARSRFMSLTQASSDWIRETSLYMVARNELNRAQLVSFDEYGSLAEPEKRDRHTIQAAEDAFDAYLQAYPKGRYASSAAGLLRRVAWLKGDQQALGNAYSALLRGAAAKHGGNPDVSLIEEIDLKLLPAHETSGVTDPVLLAVIDLVRLRKPMAGGEYAYGYGDDAPQLERAELERQRPLFKSEPALFDYLLASEALYGRKQPREVLALIPDAAHQKDFTYVQFSRQMLRGFALEAVKDPNARGFWLSLLPGATRPYQRAAVELALAEHDGAAGAVERLLTAHSPVRHPLIRQRMVEEEAGPALLRQLARSGATTHEREVSLYLLLAGELHHGLYADFLKDSAMVGARPVRAEGYYGGWEAFNYDPFYADELGAPPLHVFAPGGSSDLHPCPDIRATAASLVVNLSAIRPQLCLAEFIRRKGFDHWNVSYDAQYRPLTRPRNGFPGQPLERINIYKTVIASSAASPDDKAFALNRAVRCFAPSGSSSCGGDDIPVAQRKAWFTQLKRDYPQSSWAKDLKHYW